MANMTIRNLDEALKKRLRIRAAIHGRPMEDEARDILRSALATSEPSRSLVQSIRARLESTVGVELDIPTREAIRDAPDFER